MSVSNVLRCGHRAMRLVMVCLLVFGAGSAAATDLRGRVDGQNRYSPYPFPVNGAKVDLWAWYGGGWRLVFSYFTGSDGMYYLRGIAPGNYTLQINGINYPLAVYPSPYQDIPPIILRY